MISNMSYFLRFSMISRHFSSISILKSGNLPMRCSFLQIFKPFSPSRVSLFSFPHTHLNFLRDFGNFVSEITRKLTSYFTTSSFYKLYSNLTGTFCIDQQNLLGSTLATDKHLLDSSREIDNHKTSYNNFDKYDK